MGIRIVKELYILIYPALLYLVGCTNNFCSIENIKILNNPNKSYSLVRYEKDCGATTSKSLNEYFKTLLKRYNFSHQLLQFSTKSH